MSSHRWRHLQILETLSRSTVARCQVRGHIVQEYSVKQFRTVTNPFKWVQGREFSAFQRINHDCGLKIFLDLTHLALSIPILTAPPLPLFLASVSTLTVSLPYFSTYSRAVSVVASLEPSSTMITS